MKRDHKAGQLVKIGWRGGYCHYAVVSDRWEQGKPMLISLSRRTGTVAEECWDEVVRGREVRASRLRSGLHAEEILWRARDHIGVRPYSFFTDNCEHFARESLGLPPRSRQLQGAAGTGIALLLLTLRFVRVHPLVNIAASIAGAVIGSRLYAR